MIIIITIGWHTVIIQTTLLSMRRDIINSSAGTTGVNQDCPGQMQVTTTRLWVHFTVIAFSLHHLIHTQHWHLLSSFFPLEQADLLEMHPWAVMFGQSTLFPNCFQATKCKWFSLGAVCSLIFCLWLTPRCLQNLLFLSSTEVSRTFF